MVLVMGRNLMSCIGQIGDKMTLIICVRLDKILDWLERRK